MLWEAIVCWVRIYGRELLWLIRRPVCQCWMQPHVKKELPIPSNMVISLANRNEMAINRMVILSVKVYKPRVYRRFSFSSKLKKEITFGGEWIRKNEAVLSIDLSMMSVDKEQLPMENHTVVRENVLSPKGLRILSWIALKDVGWLENPRRQTWW